MIHLSPRTAGIFLSGFLVNVQKARQILVDMGILD